jgi:hypothetical protein
MNSYRLFLAALLALALTPLHSLQGATATKTVVLAWDPDPYSPAAGYRLYEGTTSQTYTNVIDAGSATSLAVSNLVPGMTYYFAVAAYDTNRLQGPLSAEISYTVPPLVIATTLTLTTTTLRRPLLKGTSAAGNTYDVLATRDLASWTVIGSVTADASGNIQFTDTNSISTCCFYKLRQTSP